VKTASKKAYDAAAARANTVKLVVGDRVRVLPSEDVDTVLIGEEGDVTLVSRDGEVVVVRMWDLQEQPFMRGVLEKI
jgi:translation initiation factor IF-1